MAWPLFFDKFYLERKLVFVSHSATRLETTFNFAQVRPYLEPKTLAHTHLAYIFTVLNNFKSPSEDLILAVEVLDPNDDHARGPEMSEAKKAEIRALLGRGTFKVVLREEVQSDANVLPGSFVLFLE